MSETALPLGDSGWWVWRWSCLRSAGFPAALVLRLAAANLPAAADAVIAAEDARLAAREKAVSALKATAGRAGGYSPRLSAALNKLRRFQAVGPLDGLPDELHQPLAAYDAWAAAYSAAQARLAVSAAEDSLTWRAALRDLWQRSDMQRAMIWQNRRAYAEGLRWLLEQPLERVNHRIRKKERFLARYLQRYCVKNDTIGFFGPSAWVSMAAGSPALRLRAGQNVVAERSLHLENWGVDLLARAIEKQGDLKPWLAPRRVPLWYAEDDAAHFPFIAGLIRAGAPAAALRSAVPLSRVEQAALAACDGAVPACVIAADLAADPANELSESAALALLAVLAGRGLIEWALRVAPGLHPERDLRRLLERVDDPALRAAALAPLDALDQACQAVFAAGTAPQLAAALAAVDDVFGQHTRQAATRAPGQAYAARTLVYEDCRRDVELTLGPAILDRMAGPLALLAQSARWFTFTVAAAYQRSFEELYRGLAAQSESGWVDMLTFSRQALPLLQHGESPAVLAATAQFQARWADVLRLPDASRTAAYRSADLAERAAAAFAAPQPGWPMAGYLAPDVLIAARSAEVAGQGDFQLVMGELHLYNTLALSCLVAQSPAAAQAELGAYLPSARVMAAAPAGQTVQRTAPVSLSADDRFVLYSASPGGIDPRQSLPIGELGVEAVGRSLQVRTRDGRWRVDLLAFFDYLLVHQCRALPAPLALERTPRVVIDGVCVWRAGWRFAAQDLLWGAAGDDADRMLAARRWRHRHSLPRWIYVRAPGEPKPLFVDLDAPISLQILGAAAEQAVRIAGPLAVISVSEMLPAFDELWLADAADQRYTSELRMVMADPCPWRPAIIEP